MTTASDAIISGTNNIFDNFLLFESLFRTFIYFICNSDDCFINACSEFLDFEIWDGKLVKQTAYKVRRNQFFKPKAYFDSIFVLIYIYQKKHTIMFVFLTYAPGIKKLNRIFFYGFPLKGFYCYYGNFSR